MGSDQKFRDRVNAICQNLPGAEKSDPWGGGHDAWKVGGKMFACMGTVAPGVSVKCADVEMAQLLIEAGVGRKAPYFHRSWINLSDDCQQRELSHRIEESCRFIVSKLPKATQRALQEPNQEGA